MSNLSERIREIALSASPAERRVAQVLFSTNLMAGLDTVARLAEQAKVSGPTVLRFVIRAGFASYPAFQEALRLDIGNRLASPLDLYERSGLPSPGSGASLGEAAQVFNDGISRTLARLDRDKLHEVVELLADPSRAIYLVGGRFTQHLAEVLWGHLHQLRSGTHILRPGVVAARDHLVDMGKRDVLVAFDVRRYQEDTIELAEFAKLRKTNIVLITDPLLSPIARVASIVLTCDLDAPSPYDSMVPCLALVEVIVAALTQQFGDRGRRRLVEIEQLRHFGESLEEAADPDAHSLSP
jgi:DNA-binding MurR/RpiR family transcriptional regulator